MRYPSGLYKNPPEGGTISLERGANYTLPAGFYKPRHITAHGSLSQFVAAETELAVHTMRSAGNPAAAPPAGGAGVAGLLLQLQHGLINLLVAAVRTENDRLQLCPFLGIPGNRSGPLEFTGNHAFFGHNSFPVSS